MFIKNKSWRNAYHIIIFILGLMFSVVCVFGLILSFSRMSAIITHSERCMEIGKRILRERGTAVETAIAILACECVASPGKTGFGGGFVALIYRHETRQIESLVATERSPKHESDKSNSESRIKYVGVPGMLKGLWAMYTRYETTKPWKHLLHGTLELASEYVKDNSEITKTLEDNAKLINSKKLKETLTILMNNEPKEFYEGDLGEMFVNDVIKLGGTMKMSDLKEYEVSWERPYKVPFQNKIMYTTPSPTAGILSLIYINILSTIFRKNKELLINYSDYLFRLGESYKMTLAQWRFLGDSDVEGESKKVYAYMQEAKYITDVMRDIYLYRPSELQFDKYQDREVSHMELQRIFKTCEDNVTTDPFSFNKYLKAQRISMCDFIEFKNQRVMDIMVTTSNSDTVIISTSLTSHFGAGLVSNSTGIIMNDHLSLFSSFDNLPNSIAIRKRPLNWYTPIMLLSKEKKPILMLSSAGNGERNIQTIVNFLFKYYIARDFAADPTLEHMINKYRTIFDLYDLSTYLNGKLLHEGKKFYTTTIIFENAHRKEDFFKTLSQSDSLFVPNFGWQISNNTDFGEASVILHGEVPQPIVYNDARSNSAHEWIFM